MRQKLSSLWLRIKQNIAQPRPYLIQEKISLWIATPFLFCTRPQGEWKREKSFSVEPGEIRLALLE